MTKQITMLGQGALSAKTEGEILAWANTPWRALVGLKHNARILDVSAFLERHAGAVPKMWHAWLVKSHMLGI